MGGARERSANERKGVLRLPSGSAETSSAPAPSSCRSPAILAIDSVRCGAILLARGMAGRANSRSCADPQAWGAGKRFPAARARRRATGPEALISET